MKWARIVDNVSTLHESAERYIVDVKHSAKNCWPKSKLGIDSVRQLYSSVGIAIL